MDNTTIRSAVREYLSDAAAAEIKYGPIGSWDVSHVSDMCHMFYGAAQFNADLSGWDVSRVTNIYVQ